jgi:hypothetical protein
MEFVKALYVRYYNKEYLDGVIYSGINTFFFNINGIIEEEQKMLIKEYSRYVNIIPMTSYIQPFKKIPVDKTFFDGIRNYAYMPCPTCRDTIRSLLDYQINMIDRGLCNSIGVDFRNSYNSMFEYYGEWKEHQCKCDRCRGLSIHEQRVKNTELIRDEIGNTPLYTFSFANPYILSISNWWLHEYKLNEINRNIRRMKELNVTTPNIIKAHDVNKCYGSPKVNGYWLDMSDFTPSDKYFNELKNINDSNRRDNMLFYLKKMYYK